jgi:long-chain acyl-CoA synthetase
VQKVLPELPQLKHVIVTTIGDLLTPFKGWFVTFFLRYIARKIPAWHLPKAVMFHQVLKEGKSSLLKPVTLTHEDVVFLQYTGGTTGVAKGAMLTHRNLIANILQADAWFKNVLTCENEIIITALPLYHIFSLTANCLYFSKLGGLNVLITNPRDISSMLREMRKFKFTAITGVNTLFNALIRHPKFPMLDFTHLHLTLGGGMAVQKIVAEKWQKITKKPLLEAYGLTETSPCVTINPANLKEYNGSIGLPVSSTIVHIVDEKGQEVPLGQPGELAVQGPQVMKGYWQHLAETKTAFTPEGWFLTGDMAVMDEHGFIKLLERKKDMILVSGFNVYPNEIEDVLIKLPGVKEVAVIGVPDENSGEVPKAFIVKDDPHLTVEKVHAYTKENLTPYKHPKVIRFVDDLPKSNVGKILRRALRALP